MEIASQFARSTKIITHKHKAVSVILAILTFLVSVDFVVAIKYTILTSWHVFVHHFSL